MRLSDEEVEFVVRLRSVRSGGVLATVMTRGVDWYKVGLSRRVVEERLEGAGEGDDGQEAVTA